MRRLDTGGDVDRDGQLDFVMGVVGGSYDPNRTTISNLHYYAGTPGHGFAAGPVGRRGCPPIGSRGADSSQARVDGSKRAASRGLDVAADRQKGWW